MVPRHELFPQPYTSPKLAERRSPAVSSSGSPDSVSVVTYSSVTLREAMSPCDATASAPYSSSAGW
jgi:hypothetical protein